MIATVGKKVLVKKVDGEERSASGLITVVMKQNKGQVVAVGPEIRGIDVGDTLIWAGSPNEITVDGETLVVVPEDHILAVQR